jgi:hypothetical protein
MKNVSDHVQLTFCYNKRRQEANGDHHHQRGSHVIYHITMGKDYGPQDRLLTVEVWASGEGPSREPPVPIELEEWEDMSDVDDGDEGQRNLIKDTGNNDKTTMDLSDESGGKSIMEFEAPGADRDNLPDDTSADHDRYAAYIDPDVLADFLLWTQLDMDEYTAFLFLMTFPFYEHEWDLVGLVLENIFASDEDLEENEAEDND